jgi:hypothetical protein
VQVPPPQTTQAKWETYTNSEYGYSIDVAPGWAVNEADKRVVRIVEPVGSYASLSVYSQTVPASYTLDSYADFVIDFRESRSDVLFEVISRSEITLPSGLASVRFVYRRQIRPESCITHLTEVVALVGSQAYGLVTNVCEASLERYGGDLESMQNSFVFTTATATPTPVPVTSTATATPTPTPSQGDYFTIGSHKDDVARLQGAPTSLDIVSVLGYEEWGYGLSWVRFSVSTDRVIEWNNFDRNLKVAGGG